MTTFLKSLMILLAVLICFGSGMILERRNFWSNLSESCKIDMLEIYKNPHSN